MDEGAQVEMGKLVAGYDALVAGLAQTEETPEGKDSGDTEGGEGTRDARVISETKYTRTGESNEKDDSGR